MHQLATCCQSAAVSSSLTLGSLAGGRADAQRAEQEQQLLCGVDPQQRQVQHLRHPVRPTSHAACYTVVLRGALLRLHACFPAPQAVLLGVWHQRKKPCL